MADSVFNISKGKVNEYWDRVDGNDPANSAIIAVAFNSTATHATIRDLDTLAAIEADANTAEITNSGYARVVLTDASVAATAVDDTNDRRDATVPAIALGSIVVGTAITHIAICYDPDTTAGTDSNIIPLTWHDYAITPDGSAITIPTGVFYRAS